MTAIKIFIGLIASPDVDQTTLFKDLETQFGEIDSQSDVFDFSHTTYYQDEMGNELTKQFVSIKSLQHVIGSYQEKIKAIDLENKFKKNNKRTVNIDPGILSAHNVILFTTKNYAHRIPLSDTIYAELTYIYEQKSYQVLPWSYPDFGTAPYLNYFKTIRQHYLKQVGQQP